MKKFKKTISMIVILAFFTGGCATTRVNSISEVLPQERSTIKNCYMWSVTSSDTARMTAPMAILPLAIIFPPLLFVVWISYTAAQTTNIASNAALKEATKKCGLTTEEAMEQAALQSYIEDSSVEWFTNTAPFEHITVSKALKIESSKPDHINCKATKIEMRFNDEFENRRPKYSFISYYEMCRNNDGEIVIVDKALPESEYTKLLPKPVETQV